MTETTGNLPEVVRAWLDARDGQLDYMPDAVALDFAAHAAPLTGGPAGTMHGRDALPGWIVGIHGLIDGLAFAVEVRRHRR